MHALDAGNVEVSRIKLTCSVHIDIIVQAKEPSFALQSISCFCMECCLPLWAKVRMYYVGICYSSFWQHGMVFM